MKRILLTLFSLLLLAPATADEGMWLPSLISHRIGDMRAKGFRLTADDIYSVNKASMKDAVVLFDGGCTGELVSAEGLLLTNHHCGYDAIQSHSTLEHDYLTRGFWARSRDEELPNRNLNVRFLVRMEEVTDRMAAGETADEIVRKAEAEGKGYKAAVEQMYYGNQQFLFLYEQFDDVRLVAAPPSSIGKFGGDTDNWIWPRHTGDFSVFRVYAGPDNKPAAYSPDNVPYRPRRHFTVSTRGVGEGDFTMIYGFPGNTQQYILSDVVKYIAEISDPMKIAIRTGRLDIIAEAQESDPALRIYYAAKHATIANAWKKWQGEVLGINRLGTYDKKLRTEARFVEATGDAEVLEELRKEFARALPYYYTRELLAETLLTLAYGYAEEEKADPLFAKREPTERALYRQAFGEYAARNNLLPAIPEIEAGIGQYGSPEAYADHIFGLAVNDPANGEIAALKTAVGKLHAEIVGRLGTRSLRNFNSARMNELYARYVEGLRRWAAAEKREGAMFPDANLTLRVAYGTVAGYEYADGEYHKPLTTLDGIIAKDNPAIYDYDIPQSLRDLHASKAYGRWGVEIGGRRTVPVCFLATNHTTGGNSGSPILNARGELVGINFDRTWRSTMSDIEFDPAICRNIAVDIRYVLMVIDRIGGAGYLLDEMTLR
ncbi:S46 family peptidase [uncultured Alistipes sp.]|uniref:S46 family peptidase n=1 Tax=uncultured Alistipes sp. TaxID=538949 RepID=UPI00272F3765|nr:S46 family peptidase [uncultured Alistipes sp.]